MTTNKFEQKEYDRINQGRNKSKQIMDENNNILRMKKNEYYTMQRQDKDMFNRQALEDKLHAEKTRVFSFGRYEKENALRVKRKANTFEFLGFTHYCGKTRKGKFKVGRKTSAKKFRAKVKELNVWLRKVRNQFLIKDWWQTLCLKLQGHYEYYGISENYKSIYKFYKLAIKLARKWMSRRSQRTRISWDKMKKYLFLYPLPKPRIRHSFYTLSHNV